MVAPVISNVRLSNVIDKAADLEVVITGTGTYGIAVMESSETPPADADVVSGDATPVAFELAAQTVVTTKDQHIIINGLTPGVEYVAYIATEDGAAANAGDDTGAFTTLDSIPNPVIIQYNTPF